MQEIGTVFNSELTNNILRVADAQINKNIAETRYSQYIEGKARVAQGESLQDIRDSQGVFDRIFGTATIDGAKLQGIAQAGDKHVLDIQMNMQKYQQLNTEEFVNTQNEYVTNNLLTGDSDVDNLIVLNASKAINAAVKLHAPKHAMFVQKENKLAYETGLVGASSRLHSQMIDNTVSTEEKVLSLQSLQERSLLLPGQTEGARIESIAETVITELEADRPELYKGFVLGTINIDGTDIDTGDPILFDKDTQGKINEAFEAFDKRNNVAKSIDKAHSWAAIRNAERNNVSTSELDTLLGVHLQEFGADSETHSQITQLYLDKAANKIKTDNTIADVLAISRGEMRFSNKSYEYKSKSLDDYEAIQLDNISKLPTNVQEDRLKDSFEDVLDKSIEMQVVPSLWTSRWNSAFGSTIDTSTKKPSKAFVETMQHFTTRFDREPALFSKGMSDMALNNIIGVRSLIRTEGISIEEAMYRVHDFVIPIKEAKETVRTKDFQDKIDSFIEEPTGTLKNWLPFYDEAPVDNQLEVRSDIKSLLISTVAETGHMNEATWESAIAKYTRTHEQVLDQYAPNFGVPLKDTAGMEETTDSFDDAMTYFIKVHGPQEFGPGFTVDTPVRMRWEPEYVTIEPVDESGTPLIGLDGIERRVSIQRIGSIYNKEVTNVQRRKAINEATLDSRNKANFEGNLRPLLPMKHILEAVQTGIIDIAKKPMALKVLTSLLKASSHQVKNLDNKNNNKTTDAMAEVLNSAVSK